jgi:cobalamin synthase
LENKLTSHIYKGCYLAVAYIFLNTIIFYSHLQNNQIFDFFIWAVLVIGSLISVVYFNKLADQQQPFGRLFAHGFKTAAVATCFIFIYKMAMIYIVDKSEVVNFVNASLENAKKAGQVINDKDVAANMPNAMKVARLIIIAKTIMGTLFLGIIGGIIGAVVSTNQKK